MQVRQITTYPDITDFVEFGRLVTLWRFSMELRARLDQALPKLQ